MKNLLIILLSLLPILSYSKDTSNTKLVNIPDSTQITFKTIYNDVKEGISELAGALKVGSDQVFNILVKQQLTNSIYFLLSDVILIIILCIGYKQFKRDWFKEATKNIDWEGQAIAFTVVYSVIVLMTIAILTCNIKEIITGFINPEYGAIQDILEFIKK